MTLCRTKDGRFLRSTSCEAAPGGLEVVEVSKLSLADLQAAITALSGQPCGKLKDKPSGTKRLLALLASAQGETEAEETRPPPARPRPARGGAPGRRGG